MKAIMKNFRISEDDKKMFDFLAENGVNLYDWLHDNLEQTIDSIQNPSKYSIVNAFKAKMFEDCMILYETKYNSKRYLSNRDAIIRLGDKLTFDTDEKGRRYMKIDISDLRSG